MVALGKLKWQCRRGILELDILLERYLTTEFSVVTDEERARFIESLALEDSELLDLMLERIHSKH